MTHVMHNTITRMVAAAILAVILLASGSSCQTTSGTYQGGNDSEPHFR